MILSVVMSILGQTSDGADFGILSDLFITAPLAGVMLWLYLDERKERRSLQTQIIELLKSVVPALEKYSNTLDGVVNTLDDLHRRDVEKKD